MPGGGKPRTLVLMAFEFGGMGGPVWAGIIAYAELASATFALADALEAAEIARGKRRRAG